MAGWPVPGVMVRVVDEKMHDVARDMQAIGEVVAAGDHIMEGYFREPDVIRVAPAPLYNTFHDVWALAQVIGRQLRA